MNIRPRTMKTLSAMLMAGLCITPEMASAQQASAPQQSGNTAPAQAAPSGSPPAGAATGGQSQNQGTTVDPSRAPLQPVTTYPEAPEPAQGQPTAPSAPSSPSSSATSRQQLPRPVEPAGAAAAEKVPTIGGAAAKPAGFAIAPPKQHQTRSLLIKVGAVAAGAVAVGTIYALSHGTPSMPP